MGLKKRDFFFGFAACALLVSCAATFPYRYYPYDIVNHMLMGDTPEHDLKDEACKPTSTNRYPCTCMLTDDYFSMKGDYLKTKQDLIDCQAGPPAGPS